MGIRTGSRALLRKKVLLLPLLEEVQALQILGGWMGWDMGVADLLDRHQPGEQTTSGTRITFSGSTQSSVSQPGIWGHMGSTHPVRERRGRLYFCLSSCRLTILGAFHETQKNRAQWSQDQMQKWTFLLTFLVSLAPSAFSLVPIP